MRGGFYELDTKIIGRLRRPFSILTTGTEPEYRE